MANADIKLTMKQGTDKAAPSSSPAQGNTWKQGMEKDDSDNWTVKSAYWYYYTGSNKSGSNGNGGEVDVPSGGSFTVGPQSNEVISSILINESLPGVPSTTYYTKTPPHDNVKVWTIADTEHTDPAHETDSFDVYAQDKSGTDPVVKCDPVIRNKGG